ncbi:hypothetical protein QJS66_07820 [Kocuria rhizophila]|nr:hypothetical protein QJS66_07820 [Kocuria rhizophila]
MELTTARAGRGFVLEAQRIALLAEADVLGRSSTYDDPRRAQAPAAPQAQPVDPLALQKGDYVVHGSTASASSSSSCSGPSRAP